VEIIIVLIVAGALVAAGMWLIASGRSDVGGQDTTDETELTDTDVVPPPHPEEPVPGSMADRAQRGGRAAPGRAGVARDDDGDFGPG
jgi:hypothetical protein